VDPPGSLEELALGKFAERCPTAMRFLGLPPGWRFRALGDEVTIEEDPSLLAE
jgi:hypothetical protein